MAELTMTRGTTLQLRTVVSPASLVVDSAIYFMAKRRRGDSDEDAIISKSSEDGITVIDEDAGEIAILIDPADTRQLPNSDVRLCYEIEIEKVADEQTAIYHIDEGTLQVTTKLIQRNVT